MEPRLPVLILIDNDFDELEVMYPKLRLIEAGYHVFTAGVQRGKTYTGHYGYPCTADESIFSVHERHYSAVIIPGGRAPETLRCEGKVRSLLQDFDRQHKAIATICTGAWVAISAGLARGVRMTGSPAVQDDLANAGALVDETSGVVVDRHFVTARAAADLPAFMKALLEVLAGQETPARAASAHA